MESSRACYENKSFENCQQEGKNVGQTRQGVLNGGKNNGYKTNDSLPENGFKNTERTQNSFCGDQVVCFKYKKPMSKLRILKNLVVISVAFLLFFTAFTSTANLQSTMNNVNQIGVKSLIATYSTFIISVMFLPLFLIKRLGCKLTLVLSFLTVSAYIASNFYLHLATFIPTAILSGFAGGTLWACNCTYLTKIGFLYSSYVKESAEIVIARFFGIFYIFLESTQIWGSLISYYSLKGVSKTDHNLASYQTILSAADYLASNDTMLIAAEYMASNNKILAAAKYLTSNETILTVAEFLASNDTILAAEEYLASNETMLNCGAYFLNEDSSNDFNPNLRPPTDEERFLLTGILVSCVILAAVVVGLFLDPLDSEQEDNQKEIHASYLLVASSRLLRKKNMILLVPITIFVGIQQGFYMTQYTQAFIACVSGVHYVGYVTICFGIVSCVTSCLIGPLVKCFSRPPIVMLAAAGNAATSIYMLLWTPTSDQRLVLFVIAGVWGFGDAIWWVLLDATYGVFFEDDAEAAFSNFYFWNSIGFILMFICSNYVCVPVTIYILLSCLLVGIVGYLTAELKSCCCGKKFQYDVGKGS